MIKNNFISIIIANWNGERWLKTCLDSLFLQTYKNFEVIIVDNGSTDKSIGLIESNYPDVKIFRNKENLGFGVANNIGVEQSKGDIIYFLNNDTEFSSDMLEKLVSFKKNSGIDIIGPRLLNENRQDILEGRYLQMDIAGSPGAANDKPFYIEGCALMMSKVDFIRLGGFDEKYFMYGEDIDLCWRALLYGMKIGMCEDAKIIHFGGGSSQKTQAENGKRHATSTQRRFWAESHTLRNLLKNYSAINLLWTIPLFCIQNSGESLIYLLTGKFKMFAVIWKAFFWNIKNMPDTLAKRKEIQKNRKKTDKEISSRMHKGLYKWKAFRAVGMPKFN